MTARSSATSADDGQVVGDEDERETLVAAQVGQQGEHLGLNGDIERGRRLVAEQHARSRTTGRSRS